MERIDLHTHSTASDGKNSPESNVRLARQVGLKALGITDHDTVEGIEEALAAGEKYGVEIVPGIELSTQADGRDIHILGYFLQHTNPSLLKELVELRTVRQKRNLLMIEKLQSLGLEITLADVLEKQPNKENIGRPHLAEVLIDQGIVSTMDEAFTKYLGRGAKAYVLLKRISPMEGIALIQRYGGVPVLAHPGLYANDALLPQLVNAGLKGLEVYHPDHSPEEVNKYAQLAKEYQLIATGGSDYHGVREGEAFHGELGSQPVDISVLEQLKAVIRY